MHLHTVSIKVFGNVQGVFFRKNAKKIADDLGIKGTVRNMPDGTVYIEAYAEKNILEHFIGWCRKGEGAAEVERIEVKTMPFKQFAGFKIMTG